MGRCVPQGYSSVPHQSCSHQVPRALCPLQCLQGGGKQQTFNIEALPPQPPCRAQGQTPLCLGLADAPLGDVMAEEAGACSSIFIILGTGAIVGTGAGLNSPPTKCLYQPEVLLAPSPSLPTPTPLPGERDRAVPSLTD